MVLQWLVVAVGCGSAAEIVAGMEQKVRLFLEIFDLDGDGKLSMHWLSVDFAGVVSKDELRSVLLSLFTHGFSAIGYNLEGG